MLIRLIKIALASALALWGLFTGAMNLIHYEDGLIGVRVVMGMPDIESIRAISIPLLHHFGYAFIYLGKLAMGGLCLAGALQLWTARGASASVFNRKKQFVIAGAGIGLFMLFFGFFVVAGGYFNPGGRANIYLVFHQFATFYMVAIGVVTWFVSMHDEELT